MKPNLNPSNSAILFHENHGKYMGMHFFWIDFPYQLRYEKKKQSKNTTKNTVRNAKIASFFFCIWANCRKFHRFHVDRR